MSSNYIILGAGVIGLTTALELRSRFPHSTITIIARFLPGDRDATYTSPWAGANWLSVATDNGRQESWDRITYLKFQQLAKSKQGQIMLVESPKTPMTRMYFRSPQRVNKDTTYVFPRGPHNGVVLGGVRLDNDWSGEVDLEFAEDIKRRCCALAPELGRPEDLKVIYHGVGLRPSRKGGARLEREMFGEHLVIHNYGAGGAGYQASWGMAKEAVDLLQKGSRL
ncbi:putative D-amino acid oxidase, partial [Aureobasidium melanogenum]